MQALRREIKNVPSSPTLQAVAAAFDVYLQATIEFGIPLIIPLEFFQLIVEKLPETAELLPFIKAAIDELSVACFQKDSERLGLAHAMILFRATIVSCESMKRMMFSKHFMVAISIIPCMCMPQYYEAVRDASIVAGDRLTCKFDAMTAELSVARACYEICLAVQNVLCK